MTRHAYAVRVRTRTYGRTQYARVRGEVGRVPGKNCRLSTVLDGVPAGELAEVAIGLAFWRSCTEAEPLSAAPLRPAGPTIGGSEARDGAEPASEAPARPDPA